MLLDFGKIDNEANSLGQSWTLGRAGCGTCCAVEFGFLGGESRNSCVVRERLHELRHVAAWAVVGGASFENLERERIEFFRGGLGLCLIIFILQSCPEDVVGASGSACTGTPSGSR